MSNEAASFQKTVVISAAVIVLSALLLGFGMAWFSRDVSARARAIMGTRGRQKTLATGAELFAVLKSMEPAADAYQEKINKLLPPKLGVFDLPQLVEGLARIHRVNQTFSFTGEETIAKPGLPGFVPFRIVADGSYENLLAFFKGLEINQSQFLIVADGFEFSRIDAQSYRLALSARVFFKP